MPRPDKWLVGAVRFALKVHRTSAFCAVAGCVPSWRTGYVRCMYCKRDMSE